MPFKDPTKHDDTIKNKIKTTKHYFDTCEQERIAHNRTMMIIPIVTNIVGVLAVGVFVFIFELKETPQPRSSPKGISPEIPSVNFMCMYDGFLHQPFLKLICAGSAGAFSLCPIAWLPYHSHRVDGNRWLSWTVVSNPVIHNTLCQAWQSHDTYKIF